MLNIVEKFEELVNSKEDKTVEFAELILNEEFINMNSMATIRRMHNTFVVSYNSCEIYVGVTPTYGADIHVYGTLNADTAIAGLSVIFLLGEFLKKLDVVDDIINELNENAKWCGSSPFDVFCKWEKVEEKEDAPIRKILRFYRSRPLGFGPIKIPENWYDMEKHSDRSNPEKIERRTRIW